MKKFTFKTEKASGPYSSFFESTHHIKLNQIACGLIDDGESYTIRLQVVKSDINEDGNPNCKWKWIALKKKSGSLAEAKAFLNDHYKEIQEKYQIYLGE